MLCVCVCVCVCVCDCICMEVCDGERENIKGKNKTSN